MKERVSLVPDDDALLVGAHWRLESRKWLPPGTYEVRAASRFHAEERAKVDIRGGQVSPLFLDLSLLEDRRTVRGTITSESGGPLSGVTFDLSLEDEPESIWSASYWPGGCGVGIDHSIRVVEEEGVEVGFFTFENVPAGDVRMEVRGDAPAAIEWSEGPAGDLAVSVVQLDVGAGPGSGSAWRLPRTSAKGTAASTPGRSTAARPCTPTS